MVLVGRQERHPAYEKSCYDKSTKCFWDVEQNLQNTLMKHLNDMQRILKETYDKVTHN